MQKLILTFLIVGSILLGEEGMWPLNMVPKQAIQEKYGVNLSDSWIEHVQKSCLRMSSGGSGSFVSPNGLIMTNHHVGAEAIYNLSSQERDLLQEGFYASSLEEELPCPNLYVDQLLSIQDVTERITANFSSSMTAAEREKMRKVAIAQVVEEAKNATGLQPEVVTLYRGARYHLYLYKRYTDLRLVMCPEEKIAAFGGDTENFEFPRYALDMSFFRVYDGGKPLETEHYLRWSHDGPVEKEPLFVMGHPGRTERILTANHLAFLRDYEVPQILQMINEKIDSLNAFSKRGEEERRMASNLMHRYQNALKVYQAFQEGLSHSSLIESKQLEEEALFKKLELEQKLAWNALDTTLKNAQEIFLGYFMLEKVAGAHFSKLFSWARLLVRGAEERGKINEERLADYQESSLPALELSLFSSEPVYLELEAARLEESLSRLKQVLGANHPLYSLLDEIDVKGVVYESTLSQIESRRELYENTEALATSKDPMILLAKAFDPFARKLRKRYEEEVLGPQKECYSQVTHALFELLGEEMYPDATFTLRLSVGTMAGYEEEGEWLLPTTAVDGIFSMEESHLGDPFYTVPSSWKQNGHLLKETTPFNFVTTHDIIGGNSGSPMINAQGDVVGLIFDGNRHSFLWNYKFDASLGRAISVHSAVITESLKSIYGAEGLVNEILNERVGFSSKGE